MFEKNRKILKFLGYKLNQTCAFKIDSKYGYPIDSYNFKNWNLLISVVQKCVDSEFDSTLVKEALLHFDVGLLIDSCVNFIDLNYEG